MFYSGLSFAGTFDIQKSKIKINLNNFGLANVCKNPSVSLAITKPSVGNAEEKKFTDITASEEVLKNRLAADMKYNNIDSDLIDRVLQSLKYTNKPFQMKSNQPEVQKSIDDYLALHNINGKVEYAKGVCQKTTIPYQQIVDVFSVESEILLAIWGIESNYSKILGKYNTLNALYSLSLEYPKSYFFYHNLLTLIKLIDKKYLTLDTTGSWSGAVGGAQFMPTSIYMYGISLDSGIPNLINNDADILASIANYLYHKGWAYNDGIANEVLLPADFDVCLIGMNTKKTVKQWMDLGVTFVGGGLGSTYISNKSKFASLIVPDINKDEVKNKRAFLVYDNFKVLLSYNKSVNYALSLLAMYDAIKKNCLLLSNQETKKI